MFKLPSMVTGKGPSKAYFDPNLGLDDTKVGKPILEARKIVKRANEWLKLLGVRNLVRKDFFVEVQYLSSEVGDDEETVTNSLALLAFQLVFFDKMGIRVSLPDTSIGSRYGNFAEDLIVVPDGYAQTYLNSRKTGKFAGMSFIDIPKLRLATDIRPMRMDHSGTNDGKAAMVGSRQRWVPKDSPFKGIYELFSLYQDLHLGLHRDKKFAYLPTSLGGYGKEPPFSNFTNLERFMKAFRYGTHSLLIRNIINHSIDFLRLSTDGMYPKKDPLLSHIVRFQSSFHDWIKGKTIYAPVVWLDAPLGVLSHRAGKFGEDQVQDEALGRLLAERKVISEQQLEIAVEHNELCKALLGTVDLPSFRKLRDEARMKFNNFSIFSLENYGMIKELTIDQSLKNITSLPVAEVQRFFSLVNQARYNLKHIFGEEYVYWPEAMNEIYKVGPMKTRFTMSPINKIGTRGFAAQTSEYKSDYENTEEIGALDELSEWVRNGRIGKPPTRIINDDNSIIQECLNHTYNFIVTDDVNLCRKANSRTGNVVIRVPCEWYFKTTYFGSPDWEGYMSGLKPGLEWHQQDDTGSIEAFEESRFADGVMLKQPRYQKFNIWKTLSEKDKIIVVEDESFEYQVTLAHIVFDNKNLLGLKRPKQHFREGRAHSSQNWRSRP